MNSLYIEEEITQDCDVIFGVKLNILHNNMFFFE